MQPWKQMDGGWDAAEGFVSAGVEARLRYRRRPDLGIALCSTRASAAAVFTQNRFASPTIDYNRQRLSQTGGHARAVVVNAGNANAATGERGFTDAVTMGGRAAERLGIDPAETLVASTGVIGEFLPMDKILNGVDAAADALNGGGNSRFLAPF